MTFLYYLYDLGDDGLITVHTLYSSYIWYSLQDIGYSENKTTIHVNCPNSACSFPFLSILKPNSVFDLCHNFSRMFVWTFQGMFVYFRPCLALVSSQRSPIRLLPSQKQKKNCHFLLSLNWGLEISTLSRLYNTH